MFANTIKKVKWMAQTTTTIVGLSIMLAMAFGVATTALAGTGVGATFNLGKVNTVGAISKLVGSVAGPSLQIDNNSTNAAATGLDLQVEPGKAPIKVNSDAKVTNLNADKVDGLDANELSRAAFSQVAGNAATGQDGTMRSVDITVPTEGFLVISASANGRNVSAEELAGCEIQVDDSRISGSKRFIQMDGAQDASEHEVCATDAVRPVLAGSHRVEFEATDIDFSNTVFFEPSLWVIFVPFDGNGEQPVFSE